MTHLSEIELVELAEDTLDPRRAAHVETCASCREQASMLRAMLRDTASVAVPAPSPLFWGHMAARIREGVAAEPRPRTSVWAAIGTRGLAALAAAAVVIIAVSGLLLVRAVPPGDAPVSIAADRSALSGPSERRPQATPEPDNAEVWDVLTTAASGVGFEEAQDAGMHVPAAAIDHAVQDLSAAELTELGRLIQSEMKRASN